jgi:MoaA/NifB/PqqE/SkfB family radical SAM enzyme
MIGNRPGAPLFATVNVTGRCNLNCKYCFFQPRSLQHMKWEDFRKVINQLVELEVFFINLSGGEPFIHPQIDRFIQYAHSKFQHVVVLTNGTILNSHHIETIAEIVREKGSFPLQVSLDSILPEVNRKTRSDVFTIRNNIRILSEVGANIVIAMVITRFNLCSLTESITELSRYTRHFHLMTVQRVKALNDADKNYMPAEEALAQLWEEIRALKKKNNLHIDIPDEECSQETGCAYGAPCMAGFSHVVIDPSLKVRPCDRCVKANIGDLNHESMAQIWKGEAVRQVLESPLPFCQREV